MSIGSTLKMGDWEFQMTWPSRSWPVVVAHSPAIQGQEEMERLIGVGFLMHKPPNQTTLQSFYATMFRYLSMVPEDVDRLIRWAQQNLPQIQ